MAKTPKVVAIVTRERGGWWGRVTADTPRVLTDDGRVGELEAVLFIFPVYLAVRGEERDLLNSPNTNTEGGSLEQSARYSIVEENHTENPIPTELKARRGRGGGINRQGRGQKLGTQRTTGP